MALVGGELLRGIVERAGKAGRRIKVTELATPAALSAGELMLLMSDASLEIKLTASGLLALWFLIK